jgi:hypothetical protein
MSASEIVEALGVSVTSALVDAEKFGSACHGTIEIVHVGYRASASLFDASTARYRVTF